MADLASTNIKQYFSNKTIFITGATGFIGQLLLEKLLSACIDIKRIYVLVRVKNGKSTESRFKELLDSVIFSQVKIKNPNFLKKIHLVKGDLSLENLGVSVENKERLLGEVQCVFHCAAIVSFTEKLKTASYVNVRSTKDVLRLGKEMRQLQAFVYVSTAYSTCPNEEIKEIVSDPPITGEQLLTLVNTFDDGILDKITPILIERWPNTYTYSKSIAESLLLNNEGKQLPIAIVRPSIVSSTYKEPLTGWANNVNGVIGVSVGFALGLVHTIHIKPTNVIDIVPADYVVNCIIAVAWETGQQKKCVNDGGDVKCYNFVSSPESPCTIKQFHDYVSESLQHIPSHLSYWYPFLVFCSSSRFYKLCILLFHMIPAYILDFFSYSRGKQPLVVKKYEKINKFLDLLAYFATQEWKFHNKNTRDLGNKLNNQDKLMFCFDMNKFDWKSYASVFIKGIRLYLLNDSMETIEQGRKKYLFLKTVHYTVVAGLLLGIYLLISKSLSLLCN